MYDFSLALALALKAAIGSDFSDTTFQLSSGFRLIPSQVKLCIR